MNFQQPNVLYGTISISGATTTSGSVLKYNNSTTQWVDIKPPEDKTIGYLHFGTMEIPFDVKPPKIRMILYKLFGFRWENKEKSKPILSEEEEINERRRLILEDILYKKRFFKWWILKK